LPSYYEGNPKSLLEAMACGIIVICSNIPSLAEIITNNKNGILSERDTVSITNNIISTMNNTIMNSNMGNEARQFILNNCEKNLLLSKEEGLLTQTK
jgi:glycosyltransferase involved in cell wall biosynthesis